MNKTTLIIGLLLTIGALYGVYKYEKTHKKSFRTKDQKLQYQKLAQQFGEFMKTCNKVYGPMEKALKFKQFAKNVEAIENHNTKSGESYELAVNCFADLDTQEHAYQLQLGTSQQKERNSVKYVLGAESLPASVDWRSKAVSRVKNQGQCGSCWAFSAIGALEGLNAIANNAAVQEYSEQQLVDCAGGDWGNLGCNGGLMDQAFNYTMTNGIATEQNYEYKGVGGSCSYTSDKKAFQNKAFSDVPQKSAEQMKIALAKQPVAVAIDASSMGFQFYKKGVYTGKGLFFHCGTTLDHGVLAVGYGQDSGKDYFLVKNSWGASWGMSGYIEFADIGDGNGTCGILLSASYPTL